MGAIPLPWHDFWAPYKAAASQHAYAPPSPRHQPHGAAAACPPSSRRAPKGRHPLSTLQNRQPGTQSSARAPSACKFCCSVLECPPPAPSLCLERFWLLQPEPARETFPSCSSPALPAFPFFLASAFYDHSFLRGEIPSANLFLVLQLCSLVASYFAPLLALWCRAAWL